MRMKTCVLAAALVLSVPALAAPLSPKDHAEIQQLYANAAYAMDGGTWTRHIVTDLLLTPTARGATGLAYTLVITDARPQPQDRLKGYSGMYHDDLVKDASGWRFAARHLWHDEDPATPYRNTNCKHGLNNCHMGKP
jgi:hypothetical protein